MNLLLNVNENLYSIKGVVDGEKKLQAAIDEAMYDINIQIKNNIEREKKGLKPLPYNTSVKDEYGKEVVSIKETKSLQEIRSEYNKHQEKLPYEKREDNLLAAMDEIGNSYKTDRLFKEELAEQLNKALFVMDAELSPGLEKILDYFGDTRGIFNTINFKKDIAIKCMKDLIDLPNPNTGKPPKTFEQLLSNIVRINDVFKENPNRAEYIDIARSYINVSYKTLVPQKYRNTFSERGGLENFLNNYEKHNQEQVKLESKHFFVNEKNFKQLYQAFSEIDGFKNNPMKLASYLLARVPEENKQKVNQWLVQQGCKDDLSTIKVLTKWSNEKDQEKNKNKSKDNNMGRGE